MQRPYQAGQLYQPRLLKRKHWPDTSSFLELQKKRLQIWKELSELSDHPELIAEKKRIEVLNAQKMKLARKECARDIAQIKMTDQREQELLEKMLESDCQYATAQYKDLLERKRKQIRDKFKGSYMIKNIDKERQVVVVKQTLPNLPEDVGKLLDELMDVSPTSLTQKKKRSRTGKNKSYYYRKYLGSQSETTLRSFGKGNFINADRVRFGLSESEVKADLLTMCPPDSPFYEDLPESYSGTRLGPLMKG